MEQFIWETPEELDQKLAQRVRKIRKRRSITQEKLASISGVSVLCLELNPEHITGKLVNES